MDIVAKRNAVREYCWKHSCESRAFGDNACAIKGNHVCSKHEGVYIATDKEIEELFDLLKSYEDTKETPVIKDNGEHQSCSIYFYESIEYIRTKLDENELLCQLAEESAELSKAASKLSRVIRGKNPTPVTHEEALDNVFEELADVRVCMIALGYNKYDLDIAMRMPDKVDRWVERLKKMGGADNA